ncbi:MAG TPA: hypothetical protein VFH63_10485 [candidate division Zixibacteria bacterium]|nr:hypothetical protein [candidate division Zixibacteria bacterium]
MSGLRLGVRILLGSLPVGLERLVEAAVGGWPAWSWLPSAVPYLSALLAGLAVGALSLAAFQTAADYPPMSAVAVAGLGAAVGAWGLPLLGRFGASLAARLGAALMGAVLGGALATLLHGPIVRFPLPAAALSGLAAALLVLGWRLHIARGAAAASRGIGLVPAVIAGLVVLTVLPLLRAGAEIVIARASVAQFVERQVGFSSSLVALDGLALLRDFAAEPPLDPEAEAAATGTYRWVLMRHALDDDHMALVRIAGGVERLRTREVIGTATADPAAIEDAVAALRARGEEVGEPVPRLVAVPPPLVAVKPDEARKLEEADDLASVQEGQLVRLNLTFPGEGVATCAASGEPCDPRRLATGRGFWYQLAEDRAGRPVVVRTPYPPDVAPVELYGRQTADPGAVSRFVELPWIRLMTGWARLLRGAVVNHAPGLPVDRLWLGPILFGIAAVLLWLGRRSGYPVFVPVALRPVADPPAGAALRAEATGRITPPGRSPVELDGTPITLRPEAGEVRITADDPAVWDIHVPRGLGALSGVEPGELRHLCGSRPVLLVSWYGSQVRLAFASRDDRDATAALLRRD